MQLHFSTSAHQIIKSDCRRNATPFFTDQPTQLIRFQPAPAAAKPLHPAIKARSLVACVRSDTAQNAAAPSLWSIAQRPQKLESQCYASRLFSARPDAQNHSPGAYLSSTITLTDINKPTPQKSDRSKRLKLRYRLFGRSGNNRRASAPMTPSCVCLIGLFHGVQFQHLVQPSLAVLFVECVDDLPHDTNPLSTLQRLGPLCFRTASWLRQNGFKIGYFHQ